MDLPMIRSLVALFTKWYRAEAAVVFPRLPRTDVAP
jgi:hypothetical protein